MQERGAVIDLVSTNLDVKRIDRNITCIRAVARMTPEPKYLATKKT